MRTVKAVMFATSLLACVGCDHATKRLASDVLGGAPAISLAADIVRFELVANTGAFLSLGSDLDSGLRRVLFLGLVPLVLVCVCALTLRAGLTSNAAIVGLSLIAGGGLSNWLDRILHGGAVTDFVSVGVGPLRTGIFNLADVCIFAGMGLLLLAYREQGSDPRASGEPGGASP